MERIKDGSEKGNQSNPKFGRHVYPKFGRHVYPKFGGRV